MQLQLCRTAAVRASVVINHAASAERDYPPDDVQKIADNIERGLSNTMEKEIQSTIIGRLIMDELKKIELPAGVSIENDGTK